MKNQKIALIFGASALFFVGCAAKVAQDGPAEGVDAPTTVESPDAATDEATEMPIEEPAEESIAEETEMAEPTDAVGAKATSGEAADVTDMVVSRTGDTDVEQLPLGALPQDSVAYEYLIRPDDYLTKIAFNEYGNPNEWRKIYDWNRDRIGDNPEYIMPYHELELFKPENEIVRTEYEFTVHTVDSGENLWSIAGKEYSDERAWIVIFWDNDELLASNDGLLKPGMELRIRTNLW